MYLVDFKIGMERIDFKPLENKTSESFTFDLSHDSMKEEASSFKLGGSSCI